MKFYNVHLQVFTQLFGVPQPIKKLKKLDRNTDTRFSHNLHLQHTVQELYRGNVVEGGRVSLIFGLKLIP